MQSKFTWRFITSQSKTLSQPTIKCALVAEKDTIFVFGQLDALDNFLDHTTFCWSDKNSRQKETNQKKMS